MQALEHRPGGRAHFGAAVIDRASPACSAALQPVRRERRPARPRLARGGDAARRSRPRARGAARAGWCTGRADGPIAESATRSSSARRGSRRAGATPGATRAPSPRSRRCRGEDIGGCPAPSRRRWRRRCLQWPGTQERFLRRGGGRELATAHEAVLKLREGAWVAAEAYETEQLLHGYLAAVDESVRAFVLEGEGVAAERAAAACGGARELGCEVDLLPTRHPVSRRRALPAARRSSAAERRGREPDRIRRRRSALGRRPPRRRRRTTRPRARRARRGAGRPPRTCCSGRIPRGRRRRAARPSRAIASTA